LYLFETAMDTNTEMSKLKDDFTQPDLFPSDYMGLMNREARPPFRWWCIGPRGSGTGVHIDPLGTSAWNAVTHGVKRWVLFEPSETKRTVKGKDVMKKGEDDEAAMYFDFVLPRIKEAHPELKVYEGLQKPGDIIFVPGNWWHGVLNTEDCVAVTQNYVGPENFETVWKHTRREREKVASLWFRNMKKWSPELYNWACELNARDGFQMRQDRALGEGVQGGKSDSSESSSSDSSSDDSHDVVRITSGLVDIAEGTAAAAAAERRTPFKRKRIGWDTPTPAAEGDEVAASPIGVVASPMGRGRSPRSRKRRRSHEKRHPPVEAPPPVDVTAPPPKDLVGEAASPVDETAPVEGAVVNGDECQ